MKKLRAPWTYMTKAEKYKPAFVRPKQWFPRKEYKKTIKQKVFGLTTSNGKILALQVGAPKSCTRFASHGFPSSRGAYLHGSLCARSLSTMRS